MPLDLPPLNALRAFEAAGRHLSFKAAAGELYVTHGAVSRQIKVLEDHLGVKLFRRYNRRVVLTVEGQRYLTTVSEALGSIDAALVARDSVQGGLYCWAATAYGGIIRYDFGKPDQKAEAFYTKADANDCVACHALSPDGKRMALTFTGGDGPAGILEVSKRMLTANKTYAANFKVHTPDNKYLITSSKGVLSVRDPVAGTAVSTMSTGGKATMPDV